MSDIEIGKRFYRDTEIGNVQAWATSRNDVAVAVSYFAGIQHRDTRSYASHALTLTAKDARDLAAVLTAAADYAEANAIGIVEAA